jgi:hypothetical protein
MLNAETLPPESRELLTRRIDSLGLKLEGSPVESSVKRLLRELDRRRIRKFQPGFYLTDEWGCPDGEPIIGIPFYLADPRLAQIEKQINDLESDREIMMYLRHEAGHAINYAYRLFATPDWRKLFGPFHRPYHDHYRPVPFSRRFVRHIEGWYAQKHPDEDFAETFAVWLTPGSNWRRAYRSWPALRKLRYVDRIVRELRERDPIVARGEVDLTVDDMNVTVEQFYQRTTRMNGAAAVNVPLESDLAGFFRPPGRRRKGIRPAWELIEEIRPLLTAKITYWTGVKRSVVRALIERMARASKDLNLYAECGREHQDAVELTAYGTTLAMNYLTRGKFFHG